MTEEIKEKEKRIRGPVKVNESLNPVEPLFPKFTKDLSEEEFTEYQIFYNFLLQKIMEAERGIDSLEFFVTRMPSASVESVLKKEFSEHMVWDLEFHSPNTIKMKLVKNRIILAKDPLTEEDKLNFSLNDEQLIDLVLERLGVLDSKDLTIDALESAHSRVGLFLRRCSLGKRIVKPNAKMFQNLTNLLELNEPSVCLKIAPEVFRLYVGGHFAAAKVEKPKRKTFFRELRMEIASLFPKS